jgi:hypothetical protein
VRRQCIQQKSAADQQARASKGDVDIVRRSAAHGDKGIHGVKMRMFVTARVGDERPNAVNTCFMVIERIVACDLRGNAKIAVPKRFRGAETGQAPHRPEIGESQKPLIVSYSRNAE